VAAVMAPMTILAVLWPVLYWLWTLARSQRRSSA